MLSTQAIKTILDLRGDIELSEELMAKKLKVTFYPYSKDTVSGLVYQYAQKLEQTLSELGVEVIPYERTLEPIRFTRKFKMLLMVIAINAKNFIHGSFSFFNFNWGAKVKKGIAVFAVGEQASGDLPVDHVLSLRENPMVLVTDQPNGVTEKSSFHEHLEASLKLFSWNVVNLIVSVGDMHWTVYSFNMSYPMHRIDGDFSHDVLHSLLPKVYAPVIPPQMRDFEVRNEAFNTHDEQYAPYLNDLVASGGAFEKTKLYPEPKKIDELNFRNAFYRWLGSLILDKRNGMSYGFIARQLPVKLETPLSLSEAKKRFQDSITKKEDFFYHNGALHVIYELQGSLYVLKVPEVWVLTSRSGSDKTKLDPNKDIIKMGLVDGKMIMETPHGVKVSPDYKPSFDTKVIFSHAAANAIFASIMRHANPDADFPRELSEHGRALAHWHGYFKPDQLPRGWYYYGHDNPPISCSAPQGAVYAFRGKEELFYKIMQEKLAYAADVHLEPQHGSNISYSSLVGLGDMLLKNPQLTKLGNENLVLYYSL